MKNLNKEASIQASIYQWVRAVAPDVLIWAVPNGGLRSKREGARLKWTGVLAGIPDLSGLAPGPLAFFFEVKPPGEYLDPPQREIREKLEGLGVLYAVVRSIDDAREAFRVWGIATKETVA